MEPHEFGEWIEKIGGQYKEDVLLRAKEEYQALTGQIFQDDKSYESRMGLFFEWFTLDRKLPGSGDTPLQEFLNISPAQDLTPMTRTLHGIFQILQAKPGLLKVRHMFEEKDYRVVAKEGGFYFNRHDVFEGRLILFDDGNFFSGNFLYHPPESLKFMKSKIKTIQQTEREIKKDFDRMEKDLAARQKKFAAHEKELNRLNSKIEKTQKPEKREKLEFEKKSLEEKGHTLSRDIAQIEHSVNEFKTNQLGKELQKRRFELMQKLSYMSLKWERSRQIALNDIYKD